MNNHLNIAFGAKSRTGIFHSNEDRIKINLYKSWVTPLIDKKKYYKSAFKDSKVFEIKKLHNCANIYNYSSYEYSSHGKWNTRLKAQKSKQLVSIANAVLVILCDGHDGNAAASFAANQLSINIEHFWMQEILNIENFRDIQSIVIQTFQKAFKELEYLLRFKIESKQISEATTGTVSDCRGCYITKANNDSTNSNLNVNESSLPDLNLFNIRLEHLTQVEAEMKFNKNIDKCNTEVNDNNNIIHEKNAEAVECYENNSDLCDNLTWLQEKNRKLSSYLLKESKKCNKMLETISYKKEIRRKYSDIQSFNVTWLNGCHRASNIAEMARITSCGGVIHQGRLKGLEPCRSMYENLLNCFFIAIGDFDIKEKLPNNVISIQPGVAILKVESPGLLLLATDGLLDKILICISGVWDVMNVHDILELLKDNKPQWRKLCQWFSDKSEETRNSKELLQVADFITKKCRDFGGDDTTCALFFLTL